MYPVLNIYPAVYPHFDLYPAHSASNKQQQSTSKSVGCSVTTSHTEIYPFICLYAPVYPHFDLYPAPAAHTVSKISRSMVSRSQPTRGRTHAQLHAVVMLEHAAALMPRSPSSSKPRPAHRTHTELHDAVMPVFKEEQERTIVQTLPPVTSAGRYPCLSLYAPVYPHFDLYPAPAGRTLVRARPISRRVRISTAPRPPAPTVPLPPAPTAGTHSRASSSQVSSPLTRSPLSKSSSQVPRTSSPSSARSNSPLTARPSPPPRPKRHRLTHSELHAMVMLEMRMAEMTRDPPPMPRRTKMEAPEWDSSKLTSGSARLSMLRPASGRTLPASPRPLSRASTVSGRSDEGRRSEYMGKVDAMRSQFAARDNAAQSSEFLSRVTPPITRASSMREPPSHRRAVEEGRRGGEESLQPGRPERHLRSSSSISKRMEMLQEAASRPVRSSVILEQDRALPKRRQSEMPSMLHSEIPSLRESLSRFPMPPAPPMPSKSS